jgi:hypothetical protein
MVWKMKNNWKEKMDWHLGKEEGGRMGMEGVEEEEKRKREREEICDFYLFFNFIFCVVNVCSHLK